MHFGKTLSNVLDFSEKKVNGKTLYDGTMLASFFSHSALHAVLNNLRSKVSLFVLLLYNSSSSLLEHLLAFV